MQNMKIEKSLNWKMHPWYLGPLIILSRNRGGAYIVCELNSTVYHWPIAAFHLIPYFTWKEINFPESAIDIDTKRLCELESSKGADFDNELPLSDDDINNETF